MKKRILTISLVLAFLVGLIVITTTATEQGTLQAGYAAISISPTKTDALDLTVGLPMSGYGIIEDRLSTGFINDDGDDTNGTIDAGHELMATVVAVTDGEDTTALLISVDTNNTNQNWPTPPEPPFPKQQAFPITISLSMPAARFPHRKLPMDTLTPRKRLRIWVSLRIPMIRLCIQFSPMPRYTDNMSRISW